jgi:hypothetical protein
MTVEAHAQSQSSSWGICGTQSGAGTAISLPVTIPPVLLTFLPSGAGVLGPSQIVVPRDLVTPFIELTGKTRNAEYFFVKQIS